jgi:hypothetical protein
MPNRMVPRGQRDLQQLGRRCRPSPAGKQGEVPLEVTFTTLQPVSQSWYAF